MRSGGETGRAAAGVVFYVDTLEYLRRGGRIGAAAAFLGSALAIKPLLHLVDGHIEPLEKVRTSARAIARLEELAVERAGDGAASTSRCTTSPTPTARRLSPSGCGRGCPSCATCTSVRSAPSSAPTSGPGMLAVVVSPR